MGCSGGIDVRGRQPLIVPPGLVKSSKTPSACANKKIYSPITPIGVRRCDTADRGAIMSIKTTALLALALIASSGAAFAQNGAGAMATQLDRMAKNFTAADKDKDGQLSKDEAGAGKTPFIAKHFDQIDANHDGKVSKEEIGDFLRAQAASQQKPEPSKKD
jgi:EF hand